MRSNDLKMVSAMATFHDVFRSASLLRLIVMVCLPAIGFVVHYASDTSIIHSVALEVMSVVIVDHAALVRNCTPCH